MSNDWIFVTQLLSLFTYVGIALGLYALLVKKKDATIQFLETQLKAANEEKPDIVLKKLNERVQIARDEVERLSKDNENLGHVKDNAMTHIISLEGVIRADKELIASLEDYKEEAMRLRPVSFFLYDVLEHLEKEGRHIEVHKSKDGTVEQVIITLPKGEKN